MLTWSDGAQELRARAGHGRRDKSDEELAEEDDLASADLLAVDREDWPRLAVVLEVLFRVGEREGLAAAKAWLTEHGIGWRELAQAPRARREDLPGRRSAHRGEDVSAARADASPTRGHRRGPSCAR